MFWTNQWKWMTEQELGTLEVKIGNQWGLRARLSMNFSKSSRILSHLSPLLILLEVLVDIQSPGPEFFSAHSCKVFVPLPGLAVSWHWPVMAMGLIMGHMGMLELDDPGYHSVVAGDWLMNISHESHWFERPVIFLSFRSFPLLGGNSGNMWKLIVFLFHPNWPPSFCLWSETISQSPPCACLCTFYTNYI